RKVFATKKRRNKPVQWGQKNDEIYLMVMKPRAPHHRGRIPQENRDYRSCYGTSAAVTAHTMYLESVK
ncbi:MAG: hypothetical protein ACFNXW_05395, partial [Rothia dentocariosa]